MAGSPMCDLDVRFYPRSLRCRVVGEIDEEVAPVIEEALVRWMEDHPGTVVLDCREVEYICAGALRMLGRLREAAVCRGCRFDIIANPLLRRVLRIVGMDRQLTLIDPAGESEESAPRVPPAHDPLRALPPCPPAAIPALCG